MFLFSTCDAIFFKVGLGKMFSEVLKFFSVANWKPVLRTLVREFIDLQTVMSMTVKRPDSYFKCLFFCQLHHLSSAPANSKLKKLLSYCHRQTLWSDRTNDWIGVMYKTVFLPSPKAGALTSCGVFYRLRRYTFPNSHALSDHLFFKMYYIVYSLARQEVFKLDSISTQSLIYCLWVCLS